MEGSANIVARLAVKNFAPRPILLGWENGASSRLRLAKDNSIRSVVSSQLSGRRTIVLDVGEEREFDIYRPRNFDELATDDWLHLELSWKFPQPILWQPERKIRVAIKKKDFALLTGEAMEDDMETN
jgi:hypothetical protein